MFMLVRNIMPLVGTKESEQYSYVPTKDYDSKLLPTSTRLFLGCLRESVAGEWLPNLGGRSRSIWRPKPTHGVIGTSSSNSLYGAKDGHAISVFA